MLSLFDLGRIKQAYVDCGTVAGTARATGVSRKAIAAAIARNYKPLVRKTHRNRSIVELRTKISRLAHKQSQKQHRKWPTHSSAKQIQQALQAETGKVISVRSTQRHLRKKGLKPLVRKALPTRKRCELAKKKEFARKHQNIRWKEVVFTDESWVCCNERTGRIQWAKRVEDVLPLEKKARWNVPSIMVWGAVGYNFKSKLVIFPSKVSQDGELRQFRLDAGGYVRRCLGTITNRIVRERRILMHDGARSHTAKKTMEYLTRQKRARVLDDWPPYCPDLNVIERVWKELKEAVGKMCPLTVEELTAAVKTAWDAIPQATINRHCAHFPKQLRALAAL